MTVWALIPFITSLAYITLLVLTLQAPKRRTNRVFALYLTVATVWSFTSFMLHLNALPQQALLWNELLVTALVGTLITYYHFTRAYVSQPAGLGATVGYALLFAMGVLSLSGYIVQYAYVINGVLYHSLGVSLYFIGAISLTFIGAVIVLLIKKYRHSFDRVESNRTIYLIIGWSILILSAYTNLIPPLAPYPFDHIGSLINASIITYAIRRYHLLDLRIALRQGLVYSSLTVVFTAVYLLALFVVQRFFENWTGYSGFALVAGLALLVAVLFHPLRSFVQRKIDQLFYRDTYDYRQMLFTFSHKISNVLDLGEVAQSILDPLIKVMHIKQAALLFPESGGADFNTSFAQRASPEEPLAKLRLASDSPVVTWLTKEGQAFRRDLVDTVPQMKGLWESERDALRTGGIELLCPIRRKGNLIGILALSRKQSEMIYSDEEVDLLMTMANEATVAVENARMLDSLKKQQLRVEQLLAQTVLAQEDERKRISGDLHDSVAQWLVAASYRAQTCRQIISGDNNEAVRHELATMESTITKSLKELRRVVIGLRPPALDELGLTHALRQSLEELRSEGLDCKFTEVGTPLRLPSSVEIAVYRIVQESLYNVRKHAHATKVNLRLQFQEDKLAVEIRDNGCGFDLGATLDSATSVGHLGLLGMRQRVEMLGGDIKVKTSDGTGTAIILTLPIQPKIEED